jgi:hypothetical protein
VVGLVWGLVWGLHDGLTGGSSFAWFYNPLASRGTYNTK